MTNHNNFEQERDFQEVLFQTTLGDINNGAHMYQNETLQNSSKVLFQLRSLEVINSSIIMVLIIFYVYLCATFKQYFKI